MERVDLRVNSANYFAIVFIPRADGEYDRKPVLLDVPDIKTPQEIARKQYGPTAVLEPCYKIHLPEILQALATQDAVLREDGHPKGVAQFAGLEGEIIFEGIL